jgi:hypothetical protein
LADLLYRTEFSMYQPGGERSDAPGVLEASRGLRRPKKLLPFPGRGEQLVLHAMPIALPRGLVVPGQPSDVPGLAEASTSRAGIR